MVDEVLLVEVEHLLNVVFFGVELRLLYELVVHQLLHLHIEIGVQEALLPNGVFFEGLEELRVGLGHLLRQRLKRLVDRSL